VTKLVEFGGLTVYWRGLGAARNWDARMRTGLGQIRQIPSQRTSKGSKALKESYNSLKIPINDRKCPCHRISTVRRIGGVGVHVTRPV
jgi:hypothetical protein